MKQYKPRPIRFLELLTQENWQIKVYSISDKREFVSAKYLDNAKKNLSTWLEKSQISGLETYQIATLILHEGKEGCFAIINWWIDENMLQHFVYLSPNEESDFTFYSDNGIITCVWEMAVLWFERNAWVKHVLATEKPDFEAYINEQFNQD